MKANIKVLSVIFVMATMCLLNGCGTVRVSPSWWFTHKISSADRVVVTNSLAGISPPMPGLSPFPSRNFSLTLTGPDAQEIIHAVSTLQTEVDMSGESMSATAYEWRLQFYHGKKLLGDVGMSPDLIECGDYEYPSPPVLKKLYERIDRESRAAPTK